MPVSFGLPGDLSPTPPHSQFLDSLAYPIEEGGGLLGVAHTLFEFKKLNVMKGKTEEKKRKRRNGYIM